MTHALCFTQDEISDLHDLTNVQPITAWGIFKQGIALSMREIYIYQSLLISNSSNETKTIKNLIFRCFCSTKCPISPEKVGGLDNP